MMTEIIGQFIVPLTIAACVVGSVGIATLIIVLRDKISGIFVSRSGGFQMHTNDVPVWSEIVDMIKQFDSEAHTDIRKKTTGLTILDIEQYKMSAEAMLVNERANLPLVFASYENNHTRAIAADGGDVYLANKTNDIIEAVKVWKNQLPELTDERCESFAYYWFKKIVSPIIRKTCLEKIAFYGAQLNRNEVSKTIKTILIRCRDKNMDYIQRIDELTKRPDITEKSAIFYQPQTR